MKIKVNRLPRVKLADLLEKYGLKLTVEQTKSCGKEFKAEIWGLCYTVRGSDGESEVTAYGFGDSPYSAIVALCASVDGYCLEVTKFPATSIGRVELIPPEAYEIEEAP